MRFQKDKQLLFPVGICSIVLVIGVTAGLAAERSRRREFDGYGAGGAGEEVPAAGWERVWGSG